MKLTTLCFLVSLFGLHASNSYSQKTVTLKLKDVQVSQLLDLIENQTEYHFVYKVKDVNLTRKIQVNAQDEKVSGVLDKIFKGTDTKYEFYEDQIFLTRKPSKLSSSTTPINLQETITVTGTVTEAETGMPVPAANILETGTSNGVMTDFDGNYSIEVPDDAILQVSYIGYATQEVEVNGRNEIDIVLNTDADALDEVVVVGYGTQAKRDLTGSVSVVDGDDIENRSVTNTSNALQGAAAGVSVTRGGSAPGSGNTIRIRGITTLQGDSSPLILVDNVPVSDINDVNPDQIESISVLKDAASAAIYGSRAAAGVIIITTKRGKEGRFSLNYSGEYLINSPTETRNPVGGVTYMRMDNEKRWNDNGNGENEYPIWPQNVIENYASLNAENPDQYPNTNWKNLILKDNSIGYRHSISLTAGSEKIKTSANMSYEYQNALYDNQSFKRYTARINNDIKLSKKFGGNFDIAFKLTKNDYANFDPTSAALNYAPVYPALWSDGRYAGGKSGENVYYQYKEGGFGKDDNYLFYGKVGAYFKPWEDLKISVNLAPNFKFSKSKDFNKSLPYWDFDDPDMLQEPMFITGNQPINRTLTEGRYNSNTLTTQALINYDKQLGKHSIKAVLGYEEFYAQYENLGVQGRQFISNDYPFLNQAPIDKVFNSNTYLNENSYSSYFGRFSYNFNENYFLQGTVRRDGSSRFGANYRWGTFPSVSAGWVLSEEPFMKNLGEISFLKLRASYGSLGNDRLGNYLYQTTLQFSNDVLFANGSSVEAARSAAQRYLAIADISWETTITSNIGLDLSMFNNRFSLTGEYFEKNTRDMLLNLSIPALSGYEDPIDNVGRMKTKGWELSASWREERGDFSYSVNFNIFDSKSVIGDVAGKRLFNDAGTLLSEEGIEFQSWYGYQSDGIFQSQEEVDNSAVTSDAVGPGDIKYKDISGPNGTPDGEINELDKVILGGSLPRYQYGGGINLGYKNFDLGMVFQGVGKQNFYQSSGYIKPFIASWRAPNQEYAQNYWSQYNTIQQNQKAKYPRLSENASGNNYRFSDYWLRDGSYLRIKNITLGYTLPGKATKSAGINKLRVYVAGNDFFTFDNLSNGIDPEESGGYLITKTFLVGVKANF